MNERSITPRGKNWEIKQSGWIAASFFGLGGPALIYAGSKVKMNKWTLRGAVYTILQFGIPVLFGFSKLQLLLSLGAWLMAFINSLVIRKEYLVRLDTVTTLNEKQLRSRMAQDYGVDPSQLGDRTSGYIPPLNGGHSQLHDQGYGLKRNATPMMRGMPVHNDGTNDTPHNGYTQYTPPQNGYTQYTQHTKPQNTQKNDGNESKKTSTQSENRFLSEPLIFEHTRLVRLDDFFLKRSQRHGENVYFYRISGYNGEVGRFILGYLEAAQKNGMTLSGQLPPPDNQQLLQYENEIGREFESDEKFVVRSIVKWLPQLEPVRRRRLARSLFNTLTIMKENGTDNAAMRNLFIKAMCLFKFGMEHLTQHLGEDELPKLLFEGAPDYSDLMILNILSDAGCDAVILLYDGEEKYLAADPYSQISEPLLLSGMGRFPDGYGINALKKAAAENLRLYKEGKAFIYSGCTNSWVCRSSLLEDIAVPPKERGSDPQRYYNLFARITGVRDKGSYLQELFTLYRTIKSSGRGVCAVSGKIDPPTSDERKPFTGGTYETSEQLISELAAKIQYGINPALQYKMSQSFTELMNKKAKDGCTLRELRETGVKLVCWLTRYMTDLFPEWEMPQVGTFFYMGGCRDEDEAAFMQLLADLPADVLILLPGEKDSCCLCDERLMTEQFADTLEVDRFPTDPSLAKADTAAYRAERELDSLLYEDSGLFRSRQYDRANAVTLKTMYEEIALFWKEELKYRPNFSITGGAVNMPVIFSKISGVKKADTDSYWEGIHDLITRDTALIVSAPYMTADSHRSIDPYCKRWLDGGRLLKDEIVKHPSFRFGYLREETIGFMLDKLSQLLESRVIKGTFAGNGTEYRIVATVLGIDEYIARMIQRFDFTKTNPKLIYIQAQESQASFEDAVIAAFLNLIGFDIIFFVPTGFSSAERFYSTPIMEEHQAGEYMYDLPVPDIKNYEPRSGFEKWQDKFRKK